MSGITFRKRVPGTDKFGEPETVLIDPLPLPEQVLILTEAVTGLNDQIIEMQKEIEMLKGGAK